MVDIGYTIMGEQRGPRELVADAVLAEQAGFDFLVASDHYSPWLEAQGHAPYTWAVLGAVAQATARVGLMTYVTCPTVRYHPAVVAQKAATMGLLSQGRFSLGLGAGENLNEHVVGQGWHPVDVRHEMLTEAVEIIRALFDGGFVNYRGQHFDVESAKLYDLPEVPVRIGIAASGPQSCTLAATLGDFAIGTEPTMPATYRSVGGTAESVGQIPVCYGEAAASRTLLREQFRWAALGWKVQAELPGTAAFDAASAYVREEDMSSLGVPGDDVSTYVEKVREFTDAGYQRVALVQVGPDQEAFCSWYADTLAPALRSALS